MKTISRYIFIIVLLFLSGFVFLFSQSNNNPISKINEDFNNIKLESLKATINGSTSVCQNAKLEPEITFTGMGGVPPYTFSYQLNGILQPEISTSGINSTVTISTNATKAGTFNYTLLSVKDNTATQALQTGTASIIVNPMPDLSINSSAELSLVNGQSVLKICSNTIAEMTLTNVSTTLATNSTYEINWGDGTPSFTSTNWNSTTHTYSVGLWTLTYTVIGQGGCSNSKTYNVYVGSNPAVSLGSPGNTDNCSNIPLTFPITGADNNPPSTIYTVTFNDGTPAQVFNHPPPSEITHTFSKTSCGVTSYNGTSPYPNSFSASIVASNACGVSAVNVVPIYISTSPVVNFNLPKNTLSTNAAISFTNTTSGYVNIGANCSIVPKMVWQITPVTGFTLTSGSMGNDFGQDNSNLWIKGTDILTAIFTVPGTYKVKLRVDTKRCGNDQIEKIICVEAPLKPQFKLDVNSGCSPVSVNITNNTDYSTTCNSTTSWDISYSPENCGSTPASWSFSNGTTNQSLNPSINLVTPGIYKIKLNTTNSSGTFSSEQTVVVKKPPTVSIEKINNFCGVGSFRPKAIVSNCTSEIGTMTYAWSFPGATPSEAFTLDPGTIVYNSQGTYKVSLTVTNECGSVSTTSNEFNVNPLPFINNVSNQLKSNMGQSDDIIFTGSDATTFNWINDNTKIGLAASGTSNILSFKTLNDSKSILTANITVTPKNMTTGCIGISKTFSITVNPFGDLNQPADQIISNGNLSSETIFTSNNIGGTTTFIWTNDTPEIGLAVSGSGNIPAFIGVNNSNIPIVAKITVTPIFQSGGESSKGIAKTYNITVLPTAKMLQPQNLEICNGISTQDIVFKSLIDMGETKFTWVNDTKDIGINENGNGSILSFKAENRTTISKTATITVTPTFTYAGISNVGLPVKFTITVNPGPVFTEQPQSSYICPGGQIIPLKVSYAGGAGIASFQWFSNKTFSNTSGTAINAATTDTYIPPTNKPGTTYYYCEVSLPSGICSNIISEIATVSINNAAIVSLQPTKLQNLCVGASINEPLKVEFSGGSGQPKYQWYINTTDSKIGAKQIENATESTYLPAVFSEVGKYYYYAEITLSGDGCGSIFSEMAEINVVPDPTVGNQPIESQVVCVGSTVEDLTVQAAGGLGNFSYQWFENTVNDNNSGKLIEGATNNTFSPSSEFTGTMYYYCQISQGAKLNCNVVSTTAMVKVNHRPVITKNPLSSTICLGENTDSLKVSYSYGVETPNYQWYSNSTNSNLNGSIIKAANQSSYLPAVSSLGKTYYYCVLTFPVGNCSLIISDVVCITINPVASISSKKIVMCSGTSFTLNPTEINGDVVPQNTMYTWSNPIISPKNSVSGMSSQGIPTTDISQKLSNESDSIATLIYTVSPITGSCVGKDFTISVNVYPVIKATAIINNVSCFEANNGSIKTKITGGIPFNSLQKYDVVWSGPDGFSSNLKDISGLKPGEYSITINDKGGCPVMYKYIISQPDDILITTDLKRDINCFNSENGQISVTVTGGTAPYNYVWTKDGQAFSNSKDISNLDQGVYALLVLDANSCGIKTATYTISEPTALITSIVNQQNIQCYGETKGAVSILVSGGTPIEISKNVFDYHYFWSGPNGFTSINKDLTELAAGKYTVTVTDANSCSQTLVVEIKQPDQISVSINTKPMTCYAANDASVYLNINGGKSPYQVRWSNLGNGLFQENLAAGDYSIDITDANGCHKSLDINIPDANFSIHPTIKNISCYGAHDGSIDLKITGGLQPISLEWDDNSTAGYQRNHLSPGIYTVTLHDGAPCNIKESFLISEPQKIEVTASITNAFDCNNPKSGAIKLTVSGGTPPYTYEWSNGSTNQDISEIPAGQYFVIVSDSRACTQSAQFEIIRQKPLSISVLAENDLNVYDKKLIRRFKANISGGFSPYHLHWSTGEVKGENNEIMETNQSSVAELQVADSLGCVSKLVFNVEIADVGIFYDQSDCSKFSYQFNALSSVIDDKNYSYFWDFGDGQFSSIRNPIHNFVNSGIYNVMLRVTAGSNSSTFETAIVVSPLTKLKLDREPKFCIGDSVTVKVLGAKTYTWSNGSVNDNITISQAGEYSVIGTSINGCKDTLKFIATTYNTMNYNILTDGEDKIAENAEIHFWSENTQYTNYIWDFGDGKQEEGNSVYHTFKNNQLGYTTVKLTITSVEGCKQDITKKIWIKMPIEMPNTFSPNGDGINDIFMKGWQIKLYNRNGILLYEGNSGWDGIYKGEVVSKGVYYYVVYFPTDSGTKTETGYVRVIK